MSPMAIKPNPFNNWGTTTNDWVVVFRSFTTYNVNGNRKDYADYYWDSEANDWVGSYREVHTYDANGELFEDIYYNWYSEKSL